MSNVTEQKQIVARRAELMAELFLQDLRPTLLAHATNPKFGDYLIGFSNRHGGVNMAIVEVKATMSPAKTFALSVDEAKMLAQSNVGGLLLVIDVKSNQYYFADFSELNPADLDADHRKKVSIPLKEASEEELTALRKRLAA